MKTIGEQAKEFRLSKGWNTTRMAQEVGTSRQNIESLEAVGNRQPKYISNLAKVMNRTVDELVNGSPVTQATVDGPSVPSPQQQFLERRAIPRVVSIESAVESIANHLSSIDGYNVSTVSLLLSTLANDPDMHPVVAAGLKSLKPDVRGDPSKHQSPAQKTHSSRAA